MNKIAVRVDRTRMAMPGCFFSYDGVVALADLGMSHKDRCTTIVKDGINYLSYEDATRPPEIDAMPLGWDRYQAVLEHNSHAQTRLLHIAKCLYPEIESLPVWPTLWVEIPGLNASHDTRYAQREL